MPTVRFLVGGVASGGGSDDDGDFVVYDHTAVKNGMNSNDPT